MPVVLPLPSLGLQALNITEYSKKGLNREKHEPVIPGSLPNEFSFKHINVIAQEEEKEEEENDDQEFVDTNENGQISTAASSNRVFSKISSTTSSPNITSLLESFSPIYGINSQNEFVAFNDKRKIGNYLESGRVSLQMTANFCNNIELHVNKLADGCIGSGNLQDNVTSIQQNSKEVIPGKSEERRDLDAKINIVKFEKINVVEQIAPDSESEEFSISYDEGGVELQDLNFSSKNYQKYNIAEDKELTNDTVKTIKTRYKSGKISLLPDNASLNLFGLKKPMNVHAMPFFCTTDEIISPDEMKLLTILDYEINKEVKSQDTEMPKLFVQRVWKRVKDMFTIEDYRSKYLWDDILRSSEEGEHSIPAQQGLEINQSILSVNNTDMLPYDINKSPIEDMTTGDKSINRREYKFIPSMRSVKI